MQLINEDYEIRQKKKFKSNAVADQVDLENPPLPDHHFASKRYCPNCTREHLEKDCDKSGGRGERWNCATSLNRELHWVTE